MKSYALVLASAFAQAAIAPAAAEPRAYDKVVAAAPFFADGDANRDPDYVVLDRGDGSCRFDLYVYLRKPAPQPTTPDLYKEGAMTGGGACGNASLRIGPKGAIMIDLFNDWHPPMGRETVTIVYRNKEFVVAGYTQRTSSITGPENADKPEKLTTCDVNFLTGKGMRNGKPLRGVGGPIKMGDWSGSAPDQCRD